MLKLKLLAALIITGLMTSPCIGQTNNSTQIFAENLKRLIALNNIDEGFHDFSGPEAIRLSNATALQLIELTAPYHRSQVMNAKDVCFYYLSHAILKKETSQEQKQQLVELICRYYLTTDEDVQTNDGILLMLTEKDFTANAKKYIGALIDSMPKFSYGACARLMAVAQVKKTIPALWKIAKKDIEKMHRADIDVLASLARMGEKAAAELLCTYYTSDWNKRERKGVSIKYYVSFANQLAFSLDKTVLGCLITDLRNFDFNIKERGSDYWWWPAQHLGTQIVSMLANYPYLKPFQLDPYQLLAWLNSTNNYELKGK